MALDKPNVVIPLVASYNERGVDGYATTVTSGKDQRKINSMYELAENVGSGKRTIYLTKRPGISGAGVTVGGAGDKPYMMISTGDGAAANQWVFTRNSNDNKVANSSTGATILNSATYYPTFVSKTRISDTEIVVAQFRVGSGSSANASAQKVYYASVADITTWTEITDGDFTSLIHRGKAQHLDGFMFIMDSKSKVYNSDINSLNAFSPINYLTKQIQQDNPAGLAKLGNKIIAFGNYTYEVMVNNGNPSGSPLRTVPELAGRVGLGLVAANDGQIVSTFHDYACELLGKMYFVGRQEAQQSQGIYVFTGAAVEKISPTFIDKMINGSTGAVYQIMPFCFYGHQCICVDITVSGTATHRWLMFFPEYNDWFEWTSTEFQPMNSGTFFPSIAFSSSVSLYKYLGNDSWLDSTSAYTFSHQFQLPSQGNEWKHMHWCGVEGDTATSAQSLSVEFSDNDFQSFQTARTIDMTVQDKKISKCGSYRGTRAVRLSHSGNSEVRLRTFLARIDS